MISLSGLGPGVSDCWVVSIECFATSSEGRPRPRVARSGTKGGNLSDDRDGRTTCWLSRYDDRLGTSKGRPGGVVGGVGFALVGTRWSPKASAELGMLDKAPLIVGMGMGNPNGNVSSTITIDLLPVVIPVSLMGLRWSGSVGLTSGGLNMGNEVSMYAAEYSSMSPGIALSSGRPAGSR